MYSHKTRVAASHAGPNGVQTITQAVCTMQDCSLLWMESEPVLDAYMKENGIMLILASRQVDFFGFAAYGAKLEVVTSVYSFNGFLGYRNTAIYDEETKTTYAKSWSMGVFVNTDTGKPSRLPQDIADSITYDPKLKMEYLDKKIRLPSTEAVEHPAFAALHSDIDINRHVNNAQYIRMACEYLPGGHACNRLRVEYKLAAKQGDVICPRVYAPDGGPLFAELANSEGKPYAVVEFSTRPT